MWISWICWVKVISEGIVVHILHLQRLNHDFSGQAKGIGQRGSMKMEDYRRMLHVFLPLMLAVPPGAPPPIHPTLLKALGHLRRIAENHTTPHPDESEEDRLARVAKFELEFQEYAKGATRVGLGVHLLMPIKMYRIDCISSLSAPNCKAAG